MPKVDWIIEELVTANRILARENIVNSFGHISSRHPDNPQHYLLSRARAPDCIEAADIMEFTLDGTPVDAQGRVPYLERFIHGALYEARPEVMSVVHHHSESVIPFGATGNEDQADLPHGRLDRPRGPGLGFARPFRRHVAAGDEHGDGPRPRKVHGDQPNRADARPRCHGGGPQRPPCGLCLGLSRGERAAAEGGHGDG